MPIKPQDIVILAKLLVKKPEDEWSQNSLASELFLSPSQINSAFKRLVEAGFLTPYRSSEKTKPIIQACEEFFIHGLKYIFPAKLGEIVRGIPTSYAGPSLTKDIVRGKDPIPVLPYALGEKRGVAINPFYNSLPKSIIEHPDPPFYDLISLLDAIRSGRARERKLSAKRISEILLQSQK